MAKSYAERNQESIARFGKSLYERRIEKGQERGFSRSQARGHARVNKGEHAPSEYRPKSYKAPKIEKRVHHVQRGKLDRIVNTNSPVTAYSAIDKASRQHTRTGAETRVYIKVWDKTRGEYVTLYKEEKHGRAGTGYTHGMTAKELKRRIDDKIARGQANTIEEALYELFYEDYEDYGDNSDGISHGTPSFSQIQVYILQ